MSIERTSHAVLDVQTSDIDLEEWIFLLYDADYPGLRARAPSRRDLRGPPGPRQHQRGVDRGQPHRPALSRCSGHALVVEMYSAASRVYLLHLVPVLASVRWRLVVTSVSSAESRLSCTVDVTLHPVLSAMGRMMALSVFLGRNVDEETKGFACDIARKSRMPSPDGDTHLLLDISVCQPSDRRCRRR